MTSSSDTPTRGRFLAGILVYLQPRVLIVLLLGFSGGVPIVLIGSTLQAWMKESSIDIRTIGLFAAVAVPYNIKFLWAPLVDAVELPLLSRFLGRRRGWLMLSQLVLILAIVLLAFCDPSLSITAVALAAIFVAVASATQDIIIDAFRVESLPENEQAAGMASYVAAYRIGSLVAGAGALLVVAWLQGHAFAPRSAWAACYVVMAGMIVVGIIATLLATEPERPHDEPVRGNSIRGTFRFAVESFRDFLSRHLAFGVLAFIALFKLADALAFALLTPFVLSLGFSLPELATIRNGIGFVAALLGGFVGGFICRALPLSTSLWIGALLQTIMILAFVGQTKLGQNVTVLAITTAIEFFFDAVGTIIFVAYISALCKNPLYTATQFALLTALAGLGRNVFSIFSGYVVHAVDWFWYFVICVLSGLPALVVLAWLQARGHFADLEKKPA